MKHITRLFIALLAFANLAQAAEKNHLVIVNSFQKPPTVAQGKPLEKQIQQLSENGFSPYLIQTDDYPPLRKGLWAIVLGPFDAETAKAKQQNVQTWVKDAYVKTVKPPVAKQEKYGFSTLKTSHAENNCIGIRENEAGATDLLCPGVSGQRLYLYIGDVGSQFAVNQAGYDWFFPAPEGEMPHGLRNDYPLTWIYRNDALTALSGVFVSSHADTGAFNDYRLLINVGKKQLCPVKKLFEIDDINAVLTYLNDNPSNCL